MGGLSPFILHPKNFTNTSLMKLHLPKLLRNSVLACIAAVASITTTTVGTATFTGGVVAFALASQQAQAATLTQIATMSELVGAATDIDSSVINKSTADYTSYHFDGSGAILNISNQDVLAAITSSSHYVVIAAWVKPDETTGVKSIFGYGGQSDGFKFAINGTGLQHTAKGVADNEIAAAGVRAGEWQLVGITLRVDAGATGRYHYGVADNGYFGRTMSGSATPGENDQTFAIGSGNCGDVREGFKGEIQNLTIFSSDDLVTNDAITAYMGTEAPCITFAPTLTWNGSETSHIWNAETGNTVWSMESGTATGYSDYSDVIFDSSAEYKTVSIGSAIANVGDIFVQDDYTFQVTADDLTIDAASLSVVSGKTLSLATSADADSASVAVAVSGEGALNIVSGMWTLSEKSTYTGGTTVAQGATLVLLGGDGGGEGAIRGTATVNGTLEIAKGDQTGWNKDSAGRLSVINLGSATQAGGTLHINSTSNQTLGNATINMYGGTITGIEGSNLDLFSGKSMIHAISGESTISGVKIGLRQDDSTITVDTGAKLTINSLLWDGSDNQGNKNFIKAGGGQLVITSDSTYAGTTTVSAGELLLQGAGDLGAGTISVAEGATLTVGEDATLTLNESLSVDGNLSLNGAVVADISDLTLAEGSAYSAGANGFLIGGAVLAKAGAVSVGENFSAVISGTTYDAADLSVSSDRVVFESDGADTGAYYVNTQVAYDSATMGQASEFVVDAGAEFCTADSSILNKVTLIGASSELYYTSADGNELLQFTGAQGTAGLTLTTTGTVGADGYIEVSSNGAPSDADYRGNIIVLSGTKLKGGTNNDTFGKNYRTDTNRTITVQGGAMLEVGGKEASYHVILQKGAVLASNVGNVDSTWTSLPVVDLEGDAMVTCTHKIAMYGGAGTRSYLNLNGNTLTKQGSSEFQLRDTAVSTGNIVVEEGTFRVNAGASNTTFGDNVHIYLTGGDMRTWASVNFGTGSTITIGDRRVYGAQAGGDYSKLTLVLQDGGKFEYRTGGDHAFLALNTGTSELSAADGSARIMTVTGASTSTGLLTKSNNGQLKYDGPVTLCEGMKVTGGVVTINGAATTYGTITLDKAASTGTAATFNVTESGSLTVGAIAGLKLYDAEAGTSAIPTTNQLVEDGAYLVIERGSNAESNVQSVTFNGASHDLDANGCLSGTGAKVYYAVESGADKVVTVGGNNATEGTAAATEFYVGETGKLVLADKQTGTYTISNVMGDGVLSVNLGQSATQGGHGNQVSISGFNGTLEVNGRMDLTAFSTPHIKAIQLGIGEHWSNGDSSTLDIQLSDVQGAYSFRNSGTFALNGKVTGAYLDIAVNSDNNNGGWLRLNNAANSIGYVTIGNTNVGHLELGADMGFTTINTQHANASVKLLNNVDLTLGDGTSEAASSINKLIVTNAAHSINVQSNASLNLGVVEGSGALTKLGTGALTLSNATYSLSNGLAVEAGSLATAQATTLGGALTMANGTALDVSAGALTLNGALSMGTGMAISVGALDETSGVVTLISGITSAMGIGTDNLLASEFLSALTIDGTVVESAAMVDYAISLDDAGNLILKNVGIKDLVVGTDGVAYDSAEIKDSMNAILLDGGTLTLGDTQVADKLAILESTSHGGAIKATGTENELVFSMITIADGATVTLAGGDDTTPLTVKASALSLGAGSKIQVQKDQVLDLSSITSSNKDLFLNLMTGSFEGDGTVKLKGGWFQVDGATYTTGAASIISDSLQVNTKQGQSSNFDITKNMTIVGTPATDSTDAVDSFLTVETNSTVNVKEGAHLVVDKILLGHADGPAGQLTLSGDGSTITTKTIQANGVATDNTFTMTGGTLKITTTDGFKSFTYTDDETPAVKGMVTATITGGVLDATEASWGITGGRVGTVEIISTEDKTITLTNTTITGTITNDNGKLALSGTVTLDDTDGAFQTQTTKTSYSDDETLKGNGFKIVDKFYQVVTNATAEHLDVSGTSWMVGSTAGTYANGVVTVEGASTERAYWIGNGELTYSAIKAKTNDEGETISSIVLYQNDSTPGRLVWNETAKDIAIQAKIDTTLKIWDDNPADNTEVVLNSSQVTVDSGKTLTLTGNGVYDIGNTALGINGETVVNAVKVTGLKEAAWSGTVVVKDSVGNANKLGLNELGNANSTVKLVNTQGYLWNGSWSNTLASVATNVILADSDNDYNAALTIANGSSDSTDTNKVMSTFTKKVSGTGNMVFECSKNAYTGIAFTGDVSEWTGAFIVTAANDTPTADVENGHVNLKFSGDANVIKADLKRSAADRQQLMVYLDDAGATDTTAGITMHGSIEATNLTLGLAADTADSRATVKLNNSVTVDTLTNYAATTLGASHEVEAEGGSTSTVFNTFTIGTLTNNSTLEANGALTVTTLNNDGTATVAEGVTLTASTLANSATLNVQGTLADGAAVTNSGTLNLTQAEATFASLAGIDDAVGTISAVDTALTVTGDATSGAITAKSLVLNGATNSLGELTLGALTLGADVTSLTASKLSFTGEAPAMTFNKLVEDQLNITSSVLAADTELNLSIDEEVLREAITAKGLTSLKIGTITGLDISKVTLNGDTELDVGQYTFSINDDADSGVIELLASTNGFTWAGETTDTDNNWLSPSNWDDGIGTDAPGGSSGNQAVKFLGDGSSVVVIGESMNIKYITIDIDGYDSTDVALADEDPKKVGYTFTATATSDPDKPLNVLEVGDSLSVNEGLLNVGSNVNIEAKNRAEVLAAGELRIAEKAFVNAHAGIENAGKVTIDASSTPGGGNAGALYALGNGSISNSGELYVNGTLLAGEGMENNPDGNDIINSGTIVNTGTIKADGDLLNTGSVILNSVLLNTGSVSEDMGESEDKYKYSQLQVWGNVDNEGTDSSLNIGGGYMDVNGDLSNEGSLSISGGAIVVDDGIDINEYNNLTVRGELDNSGTLTVSEDGTKVQAGSMTNSGEITIGSAATETEEATTGSLEVQGLLQNLGGTITVIAGSLTADEVETSGTISVEDGSIVVTGALTNTATDNADTSDVVEGITISGGSLTADSVGNSGTLNVTGGSLAADGMTNGGTLSIAGGSVTVGEEDATGITLTNSGTLSIGGELVDGEIAASMTVNGNLDNTGGTIIIGSAAVEDDPGTEEIETAGATYGSLTVNGNLANSGTDNNIVVNDKSTLTVTGDLAANDMSLGFDGIVTVGGTATMDNLTIEKGAEFTAENAVIEETLKNNGSLTVTTTKDETTGEITGGKLSIGTLTGNGEVHVQEGGELTIKSDKEFSGVLDNKGSMVFEGTDSYVTLSNTQKDGQTSGSITASTVEVTAGALVATGTNTTKSTGYKMGKVETDVLIIDGLDSTSPDARVVMENLTAVTEGEQVKLVLSDIEDGTMNTAGDRACVLQVTAPGGISAGIIDLSNYGYQIGGGADIEPIGDDLIDDDMGLGGATVGNAEPVFTYVAASEAVRSDYMQALLKKGLRVYFDTAAPDTVLDPNQNPMAAPLGHLNVSIRELDDFENVWSVGAESANSGLIVTDADGKLISSDILDKVKKIEVNHVQEIDLTGDKLTGVKLNNLTDNGVDGTRRSQLNIMGESTDVVNITTDGDSYDQGDLTLIGVTTNVNGGTDDAGNTKLGKIGTIHQAVGTTTTLYLQDSAIRLYGEGETTLKGKLQGGELELQRKTAVLSDDSDLELDGTDVVLRRDNVVTTDMVESGIVTEMGNLQGSVGDVTVYAGYSNYLADQYYKYFDMDSARLENSAIVADRNTSHYRDNYSSESANGAAGLEIADEILTEYYPQLNRQEQSELANALDAIENAGSTTARDELAASLAGASSAVLGMAVSGDVDRQLRAIRNRTTTMGVDQSVANEDMPYFNAWINAEGSMNELSDNGTEGGYKLNSWGGTVGFDVDICPTFTAGMAFTAMYGDLDVTGADTATGDLDTYYLSAFARYSESAWTHTFVATVGTGDISLKRTVLGSEQKVETDALSFGLMYEVGRVFALDEDGSACLQPVFNVTWKHTTVDGYTEDGSDLALKVDEQTVDTVTFGLGARLQAVVGESMYNRTSIFEARVLAKADVGDRNGSTDVGLASLGCTEHEVESAEMGAFGLEAGAGLTIPVGEEGGSIFMDASVELRSDYTDVNGTVGYRINF